MDHFRAPRWLPGGHAQTIWPVFFARRFDGPAPRFRRERWPTPDGDFVDVDWQGGAALAARWAEGRFGESGIAVLLLITGSMDVDTAVITAGGLPASAITAPIGALAIGGTVVANMMVKIGVTLFYARGAGRVTALALAASTAAMVATLAAVAIRWLN